MNVNYFHFGNTNNTENCLITLSNSMNTDTNNISICGINHAQHTTYSYRCIFNGNEKKEKQNKENLFSCKSFWKSRRTTYSFTVYLFNIKHIVWCLLGNFVSLAIIDKYCSNIEVFKSFEWCTNKMNEKWVEACDKVCRLDTL